MRTNRLEHQFAQIPKADIQRSRFNRSHEYKTTFNAGQLVPFYIDEVLPGDTFDARCSFFARLATPIVPIMDNVYLETFFFYVPNRIVWDHWKAFNGEQRNPGDSTEYTIPQLSAPDGGWQYGSLADYFGIPTGVSGLSVNALPFRAYNLIYNEWFRDENLINSVDVPLGDTGDTDTMYQVRRRGKFHDYFTSCLPWPQKGPGVELPLGSTAPVYGDGYSLQLKSGLPEDGNYPHMSTASGGVVLNYSVTGTANSGVGVPTKSDLPSGVSPGLYADLSDATAATINSFRQAMQLQKLYERDARGGTRYTEIIRSHFGVVSPDGRLQRPEFLGGSHSNIVFSAVAQTSETTSTTPQGNLAAYAYCSEPDKHGFTKSFTEHGYIIGLVNVRADLTYQQGINRLWSRQTKLDFYWPALAHLGEQAVLNKEIFAQGTDADNQVFGYQERWAEYRFFPSQITGKFRSSDAQSLDVWHLAQDFKDLPTLSQTFIEDNPPLERVLAVQDEPQILFDSYIRLTCDRPMPVYSVPGLVDHF